jgi:hypothetical protein
MQTSRALAIILFVFSLTPADRALARDSGDDLRRAMEGVANALSGDPSSVDEKSRDKAFRQVAGSVNSSALASFLEQPGSKVGYSLDGGVNLVGEFGLKGGIQSSPSGNEGSIGIGGPKEFGFEASIPVGKNAVAGKIVIPTSLSPTVERNWNPVYSVELHYPKNEDYLTLVGLSGRDYPGARATKELFAYAIGPGRTLGTPSAKGQAKGGMLTAAGAALDAVTEQWPFAYFKSAGRFDEFTSGVGLQIKPPAAIAEAIRRQFGDHVTIELSVMRRHRQKVEGKEAAVDFTDVELKIGFKGGYKSDAVVTPDTPEFKGGVNLIIAYSTDPEARPTPEQLALARAVRSAGIEAGAARFAGATLFPLVHWKKAQETFELLKKPLLETRKDAKLDNTLQPVAVSKAIEAGSAADAARILRVARQRIDRTPEKQREQISRLVAAPPPSIEWHPRQGALNVIIAGSGQSAQEEDRQSWAPTKPPLQLKDPTRRVVVEVAAAGWATDGLEKYLRPTVPERKDSVRVKVPTSDGSGQRVGEMVKGIVATNAPTTVTIESTQRAPDSGRQAGTVAAIVGAVVNEHQRQNPKAERTVIAEGAGIDALQLLNRGPTAPQTGIPPSIAIDRMVAVSPIQPPQAVPPQAMVVLQRDNLFHNFDPGSPGYERLAERGRQFAKRSDVIIVPGSANQGENGSSWSRMDLVPKGSAQSVTLSNISAAQAVRSWTPQQGGGNAIKALDGLHKPSNVGGISLVTPARLPIDGRTVASATFDRASSRLVLRDGDGNLWRLPPIDPEYARIAYDSLYGRGTEPELSIGADPGASDRTRSRTETGQAGMMHVYYRGAVENTRAGMVMLHADGLLGQLAFGTDEVAKRLNLPRGKFHTLAEMYPARYGRGLDAYRHQGGRVYLVTGQVNLIEQAPGELAFADIGFDIRLDPWGPAEAAFVGSISKYWSQIVDGPLGEPFRDLTELAKAVSLFVWLHDAGVPFDNSLAGVTPRYFVTPTDVPLSDGPSLGKPMNSDLPLTVYGDEGVKAIYVAPGRATTFAYESGNIVEVRRFDGAKLRIFRDSLDAPKAVSVDNEQASAAFQHDAATGRDSFHDRVRLRFQGDMVVGFDPTSRTRAVYNIIPEDMVAKIVANFAGRDSNSR